jgi:hypothetical protein
VIYFPPSLQGFQPRRLQFSTWVDHLPFGYDLIAAMRPAVVVELGTQTGLSYFCFCQSVAEAGVSARCYAVDTWAGDEHTGSYDESVFADVSAHNTEHYASFSTLLRMRFEEAVTEFEDESIELLHIDGFHTYEAVRNDFETWFPKVKPGGIVLFHDIVARLFDFGAWRFWSELETQFPTFAFRHGFGLGVLRKPGGVSSDAALSKFLFESDVAGAENLRAFYVHAAEYQDQLRKRAWQELQAARGQ